MIFFQSLIKHVRSNMDQNGNGGDASLESLEGYADLVRAVEGNQYILMSDTGGLDSLSLFKTKQNKDDMKKHLLSNCTHVLEKLDEAKDRKARLDSLTEEPKCPNCGCGVLRQKCMFEMGEACARFKIIDEYGGRGAIEARLKELGQA